MANTNEQTTNDLVPKEPVRFFLERFGLTENTLGETVGAAIARKADYADLYFEFNSTKTVGMEEGLVKSGGAHISQGVGVRVVAEDKTGYAHSDDVTVEKLHLATEAAQAIAHGGGE